MTFNLPPAVRLAEVLARDVEVAVSRFRRAHRYTFGATLRERAWAVLEVGTRAARDKDMRPVLLPHLVEEVDSLKLAIQLGQTLRLFSSFDQFQELMRSAMKLGQQVGGWNQSVHPPGQNDRAHAPGQRAMTLSTRAASMREVNS